MQLKSFIQNLDQFGADLRSWPDPQTAHEFLAGSASAQTALNQMAEFERALNEDLLIAPEALKLRVESQVVQRIARGPSTRIITWLRGAIWRPAVSAAMPIMLGVAVGYGYALSFEDDANVSTWVYSDSLDMDQYATLATEPQKLRL